MTITIGWNWLASANLICFLVASFLIWLEGKKRLDKKLDSLCKDSVLCFVVLSVIITISTFWR